MRRPGKEAKGGSKSEKSLIGWTFLLKAKERILFWGPCADVTCS